MRHCRLLTRCHLRAPLSPSSRFPPRSCPARTRARPSPTTFRTLATTRYRESKRRLSFSHHIPGTPSQARRRISLDDLLRARVTCEGSAPKNVDTCSAQDASSVPVTTVPRQIFRPRACKPQNRDSERRIDRHASCSFESRTTQFGCPASCSFESRATQLVARQPSAVGIVGRKRCQHNLKQVACMPLPQQLLRREP